MEEQVCVMADIVSMAETEYRNFTLVRVDWRDSSDVPIARLYDEGAAQ
jgi:hypothetical protein